MSSSFKKSLFGALFYAATVQSALAITITQPQAVVELFTSQGCNSCPPADKFVGELSKSDDVLALSWHVDYWDYLGWKDSLASKEYTQRQYQYARTFSENQVYTPQAVINGRTHAVGSDKRAIRAAIKNFSGDERRLFVPIDVSVQADSVNIKIPAGLVKQKAMLNLVYLQDEEKVDIKRGENAGKVLSYHNVVKASQPLGLVKAKGFDMAFPTSEIKAPGHNICALILQATDADGNPGAILGAVVLSDLR